MTKYKDNNFIKEVKEIKKSFPKDIKETSFEFNQRLSKLYKSNIYLKNENEQIVRSYKIRGAFNCINKIKLEKKKKGLVCASAGNHSQGFAYCCNFFKTKGYVFMPRTTPSQKINAVKDFGKGFINIELIGDNFDEALIEAKEFCKKNKMTFIEPFNNLDIIKGQATVGLEIFNQFKLNNKTKIDYIFVPIGGGGLISGISEVFKILSPQTKVIGVEPKGAASAYLSLKNKKITRLENINTFVDGASVKEIGTECYKFIHRNIKEINLIEENRICSSILYFLEKEGRVIEPAGIISIDSLKDYQKKIIGKNVVCVVSGSNFDFERLTDIKERSLKFKGIKRYFIFEFPQRKGALNEFLNFMGEDMNIVRFEYLKKTNKETGWTIIGIEKEEKGSFDKLLKNVEKKKWKYEEITNNELLYSLLI